MKIPHLPLLAVIGAALLWWFKFRKGAKLPKLSVVAA